MKSLTIFLTLFTNLAMAQFDPLPNPSATNGQIPDLMCESGATPTYFSLIPVADLDQKIASDILNNKIPSTIPLNLVMVDSNNRLRLDTCVTVDGHISLRRVLRMVEGQIEDLADRSDFHSWTILGLEEAIFDQKYTNLEINISPDTYYKHQIQGYEANTPFIAVSTSYSLSGRQPDVFGGPVLIGRLELGDSFQGSHCRIGRQEKKFSVTYAELNIETTLCLFQGGGLTLGYEIATLDITDSNGAVPEQFRGQRLAIDVPKALNEGNLVYGYSHHNDSDRFNLKVPETGIQYELWQTTILQLDYRFTYPGITDPVTGSGKGMILMGSNPPPPPG